MKTTLYKASEAAGVMYKLSDQLLDGLLSLKIYDNGEVFAKKAEFLAKETQKIAEAYHAVPSVPDDPNSGLVVRNDNGEINELKTKEFVDKVMAIRNMEIDLDLDPFTKDEIKQMKLTPRNCAAIRFMIQEPEVVEE